MIKKVYFLYNYSINCWGRIDPEAQKCKQETKTKDESHWTSAAIIGIRVHCTDRARSVLKS